jgi:hypothetical protein
MGRVAEQPSEHEACGDVQNESPGENQPDHHPERPIAVLRVGILARPLDDFVPQSNSIAQSASSRITSAARHQRLADIPRIPGGYCTRIASSSVLGNGKARAGPQKAVETAN